MNELHLTKKDFHVDWFSGTGGGGQHRNKHQNCCRITHVATGLRATGQSHRDRPSNQAEAFNKLARLVVAHYRAPAPGRRSGGEVVRHYVEKRNEIVDVASGERMRYDRGLDDLAPMIEARARALATTTFLVESAPSPRHS